MEYFVIGTTIGFTDSQQADDHHDTSHEQIECVGSPK